MLHDSLHTVPARLITVQLERSGTRVGDRCGQPQQRLAGLGVGIQFPAAQEAIFWAVQDNQVRQQRRTAQERSVFEILDGRGELPSWPHPAITVAHNTSCSLQLGQPMIQEHPIVLGTACHLKWARSLIGSVREVQGSTSG